MRAWTSSWTVTVTSWRPAVQAETPGSRCGSGRSCTKCHKVPQVTSLESDEELKFEKHLEV